MMRLLGAILLTCGAAAIGFSAAAALTRRARGLRALLGGLELLERELSFRLTPLPDLFARLARQATPPAAGFFTACREGLETLGERSMDQIWAEALARRPMALSPEDHAILLELGGVLGRFDGPGQREALGEIRARLLHQAERAEEESRRMGRVYGALGLTAGSFLVILLL